MYLIFFLGELYFMLVIDLELLLNNIKGLLDFFFLSPHNFFEYFFSHSSVNPRPFGGNANEISFCLYIMYTILPSIYFMSPPRSNAEEILHSSKEMVPSLYDV